MPGCQAQRVLWAQSWVGSAAWGSGCPSAQTAGPSGCPQVADPAGLPWVIHPRVQMAHLPANKRACCFAMHINTKPPNHQEFTGLCQGEPAEHELGSAQRDSTGRLDYLRTSL